MATPLQSEAIYQALDRLTSWVHTDDRLVHERSFDSFPEAIAFVNRVAELAEQANHHPDLHVSYTDVRVELTSHDAGGVTQRDVEMAEHIDAIGG